MAVIIDVAKLAGVSVGTVSKYLNNPATLKEATRILVEKAVKELEYKPSPSARSMRTKKTNTIAVIAPNINNPFYSEVYSHIRTAAMQNGYVPILYTTGDNFDALKDYLSGTAIRQMDGVILCFADEDEAIENFIEEIQAYVPIVLLTNDIGNSRFNSVVIDVFEGIYKVTQHLISIGHKNIAYIGGPENSRISSEKLKGYIKAMSDAGYEINAQQIHRGNDSFQSGYFAARSIMMSSPETTAFIGEDDILAIGGLKYLLQFGVKVPEAIAVAGYDNIILSKVFEPALTTISLPKMQMGHEVVKLLLTKINGPSIKNRKIIMKTELVVRNSTVKNIPVEFYDILF